jgi:hypothetical protein
MLRDRFMVEMGVGTVKGKGKNQLQVNFGLGSHKWYSRLMRCSAPYLSYSANTIPGKEEVQPDFKRFLSVVCTSDPSSISVLRKYAPQVI